MANGHPTNAQRELGSRFCREFHYPLRVVTTTSSPADAPRLTANGRPLRVDAAHLAALEPATELLGDADGLREAMADRGYLFFPGLLDVDAVLAARLEILHQYAVLGEIDDRHPIDDAIAGDGAAVPAVNLRAFSRSVRTATGTPRSPRTRR